MYLDFYGFREKPFNLTPDPRFVFLSKTHKEAFAHLLYGINNRVGFIALTGEVGSGKTTVLRALLSQLDADHYRTALIFNPNLSAPELLQNINREFGISPSTDNSSSLLDDLNLFLLQKNAEGRIAVLVVDEAQNLGAPVLEQIRLISNLETDREKLIQIVLSGQPELGQILERKEMRQLSQRITVRYHLQPMDFQDTVDYIKHRLEVAGRRGGFIFSGKSLRRIYRYSRGIPRLINVICDRALLAGYTKDKEKINSRVAAAGIKDMRRNTASYTRRRRLVLIPMFVIVTALAAGLYFKGRDFIGQFNGSQDLGAREERIEATEEVDKKDPAITGEELSRAMAAELGKVQESASARRVFNTLAAFWNVSPIGESGKFNHYNGIEQAALDAKLCLYRFSGNLGALLRIDCPAGLELAIPGIPGKRFISLVGVEAEQLLIDPPIAGRRSLSFSELEKYWFGRAFILWKDPLNLLPRMSMGSRGSYIKLLQGLLKETGTYSRPLTGVYDDDTISAVEKFQASMGIQQDGIVGGQTLMLLYRSIARFEMPRLTVARQ
jgi:general secretion pathway protein A